VEGGGYHRDAVGLVHVAAEGVGGWGLGFRVWGFKPANFSDEFICGGAGRAGEARGLKHSGAYIVGDG
jgi:hypothetical protein